jgi:hypothetical protein
MMWGRISSCWPVFQPASCRQAAHRQNADEIGVQLEKLPHWGEI